MYQFIFCIDDLVLVYMPARTEIAWHFYSIHQQYFHEYGIVNDIAITIIMYMTINENFNFFPKLENVKCMEAQGSHMEC